MEIPRRAVDAVIRQAKIEGVDMDDSDAYFIAEAAIESFLNKA